MDGAGDVFDRDDRFDLDDAMVRPEILDRARGTAARYAIREGPDLRVEHSAPIDDGTKDLRPHDAGALPDAP